MFCMRARIFFSYSYFNRKKERIHMEKVILENVRSLKCKNCANILEKEKET